MANQISSHKSDDAYFPVLFRCILASLALLVISHIAIDQQELFPRWMVVFIGAGPLIYYHLGYLRPRAGNGLSQGSIDSVYYFGFLVTVAALGISALSIANKTIDDNTLQTVVFQFGIGLFATGYAVLARMHLSSFSAGGSDVSPEHLIDRYIDKSRELINNADMAAHSFLELTRKNNEAGLAIEKLSNELMFKIEKQAEHAVDLANRAVLGSANAFNEEIKGAVSLATDSLVQLKGIVSDVGFKDERAQLIASVKEAITASESFNTSLTRASRTIEAVGETAQNAAAASQAFGASVARIDSDIRSKFIERNIFEILSTNIVSSADVLDKTLESFHKSIENFGNLDGVSRDIFTSYQKISTVTKKADAILTSIEATVSRLGENLDQISRPAEQGIALIKQLGSAIDSMPNLSHFSDALSTSLEKTTEATSALSVFATTLPTQLDSLTTFTSAASAAIQSLTVDVIESTKQAASLKGDVTDAKTAVSTASNFLNQMGDMQASIEQLKSRVIELGSSVTAVQATLAESSERFKAQISSTASALENDVRRSSASATLLTDKLVDVAQIIIDKTNATRPA